MDLSNVGFLQVCNKTRHNESIQTFLIVNDFIRPLKHFKVVKVYFTKP